MLSMCRGNSLPERPRGYLLNAFSFNMVAKLPVRVHARELTLAEAREMAPGLVVAVGHANTAERFSRELGIPVMLSRQSVLMHPGDVALLGQYSGTRLPEGATQLPADSEVRWLELRLE